jgi:D-aminopeptidase
MLRVDGVPVGRAIGAELVPTPFTRPLDAGSIIVILATDAPLLPIQCQRLARRAATGLAWAGGYGANSSGDIFLAFATGNALGHASSMTKLYMMPPEAMTPLFHAAAEATEEAILNALTMAETMTGLQGRTAHALPPDTVSPTAILKL